MYKIAIFGVPRSGTSWLSQIFNSHPNVAMRFQPLFSYGHKGRLTERSSNKDIDSFFHEILNSVDPFVLMKTKTHQNYPTFIKNEITHIVFKETRYINLVENILKNSNDCRIIGIVRNPLANLASWIKAPKEFDTTWDIFNEWRYAPSKNQGKPEEFYGFEKWKEVVTNFIQYEKNFPKNFLLVKYSDLNKNALQSVRRLFDFSELKLDKQVEQFIVESQSRHDPDPYSVYHANASDLAWKNVLPSIISESIIEELTGTIFKQFIIN
jgi:hypothetical protein